MPKYEEIERRIANRLAEKIRQRELMQQGEIQRVMQQVEAIETGIETAHAKAYWQYVDEVMVRTQTPIQKDDPIFKLNAHREIAGKYYLKYQYSLPTVVENQIIEDARNEAIKALTAARSDRYEKFNQLVDAVLQEDSICPFDNLKEVCFCSDFFYSEPCPVKRSPIIYSPNLDPVPDESWLEKIIASKRERRLAIIKKNEESIVEIKIKNQKSALATEAIFCLVIAEYNCKKELAHEAWMLNEQQEKAGIEKNNGAIDAWKAEYLAGNNDAITHYINAVFSLKDFAFGTVDEHEFGYNKYERRCILNLHFKPKDTIFSVGTYKYVKQRAAYEPAKIKVSECNERMKNLLVEASIAAIFLLYQNDNAEHFDDIVINAYHQRVCCVSAKVDRVTFSKHNLKTQGGKAAFVELQMKVFKQMANGVKPYETLYADLD